MHEFLKIIELKINQFKKPFHKIINTLFKTEMKLVLKAI